MPRPAAPPAPVLRVAFRFLLPGLLLAAAAGCGSTRSLADPEALADLRERAPGRDARVESLAGTVVRGHDLRAEADAFVVRMGLTQGRSVPLAEVRSVGLRDAERGARIGFVGGLVVGGLVGTALAAIRTQGENFPPNGAGTITLGLLFGSVGGYVWGSTHWGWLTWEADAP